MHLPFYFRDSSSWVLPIPRFIFLKQWLVRAWSCTLSMICKSSNVVNRSFSAGHKILSRIPKALIARMETLPRAIECYPCSDGSLVSLRTSYPCTWKMKSKIKLCPIHYLFQKLSYTRLRDSKIVWRERNENLPNKNHAFDTSDRPLAWLGKEETCRSMQYRVSGLITR